MLEKFDSEYSILLETPQEKLAEAVGDKAAELIMQNKQGKLTIQPGYDGVYGKLLLEKSEKTEQFAGQKSIFDY
jgi:PHP family Zn ribbon phosphoesterase